MAPAEGRLRDRRRSVVRHITAWTAAASLAASAALAGLIGVGQASDDGQSSSDSTADSGSTSGDSDAAGGLQQPDQAPSSSSDSGSVTSGGS